MKRYVLFSGGFDSTLALCNLAEISEGSTITTISIEPSFSGAKVKRERHARQEILELVRETYPKVRIEESVIKIDISAVHIVDANELTQPLFWLSSIMVCTDPDYDCEIWLGYICGDQCLTMKDTLMMMAENVSDFRQNKSMRLHFPHLYKTKTDVIKELYDIEPLLLNVCTTCENHVNIKGQFCGECVPCKHFKSALVELSIDPGTDDKLRNWCVRTLRNGFGISMSYMSSDGSNKSYVVRKIKHKNKSISKEKKI